MELSVERILVVDKALGMVLDTKGLSAKVAFRLGRFKKVTEEVMQDFNESREKLIKEKYGKENEQGGFDVEDMEGFQAEVKELLAEEVSIDAPKLKIDDFDKVGPEPRFFAMMDELIEE